MMETDRASMLVPLGAAAHPARVIVCERSGRWAADLRRELGGGVPLRETRSLAECWEALAEAPASLLVIELARGNMDGVLARLARLGDDFPLARAAVVADRSLADYQWLLREAGAVYFTCSPRQLAPLADLTARHLAQAPAPPPLGTTEQIWASLPWKQHDRRAKRA